MGASGTQFQWSGGNNLNSVAWWGRLAAGAGAGNSNVPGPGGQTQRVMLRQANQLGIYDMSGNVWEWCWDWLSNYTNTPCYVINPVGRGYNDMSNRWNRTHRGGSWYAPAANNRVSVRGTGHTPATRSNHTGFRIVSSTN